MKNIIFLSLLMLVCSKVIGQEKQAVNEVQNTEQEKKKLFEMIYMAQDSVFKNLKKKAPRGAPRPARQPVKLIKVYIPIINSDTLNKNLVYLNSPDTLPDFIIIRDTV